MFRNPAHRTLVFCFAMVALAAASNAGMDALWSRYDRSIFAHFSSHRQWLDPRISWHNKWKDGDASKGEAFPLSSTSLVTVTDAWHFFKSLTIFFILLAIVAPLRQLLSLSWWKCLLLMLGLYLLHGIVFESLYAHLLIR